MRYIFFLSVIFCVLSGCSKSEVANEEQVASISAIKLAPKKYESGGSDKNLDGSSTQIEQKIIKQASLRFETNDLEETYKQIQTAVKQSQGKVQSDSEGKDYGTLYRNITIRVPSQNFDNFINTISKGVAYFERKEITAEDVTEQYIDLTTRLKNKRKLEERYLQILQKATKISEILEIEKQISIIREEIEAKEGQLKYLESRVSESTVTIEFFKNLPEQEAMQLSYGSKIWTAIKSGFFSLSSFFISIISIWPFIIIICVLAYFIRKRIKRKKP
ncbi:DUF4349 domain-containing protein [Flavobacterium sp. WLB]|uniref:DUF4349 domain-containing protein n=1 Tax=unclassified Flavobacterium TaxID=196869 RepID=UPI0006ABE2D6|nr:MULTISPECIES: DUF4349 domain-containing protein [unclassified Flavobacterium]KOP37157.1 hypothetical protein AKO67_17085 [Flavobacterium sp. VMW]OWU89523.1 hypothetical protein APR43_17250 [Flavobacterium sp. NLM]PUU71756.1 DUF4349 domain-containing protein [Flavobacterium sp. WLB]